MEQRLYKSKLKNGQLVWKSKSRTQSAFQWTVNTVCRARLYANGTSAASQVRSGPCTTTNNLDAWRHIASKIHDHPRIYITRHSDGWFHIWNCVYRFFCRRKCNWCVFRFRCYIRRGHLVNYIFYDYVTSALIKCTAKDTYLVRIQTECKQRTARTDEEKLKWKKPSNMCAIQQKKTTEVGKHGMRARRAQCTYKAWLVFNFHMKCDGIENERRKRMGWKMRRKYIKYNGNRTHTRIYANIEWFVLLSRVSIANASRI